MQVPFKDREVNILSKNKLIGSAAIIFNTEGQILLVKHSYGKNNWDLPGGKSEDDESVAETAEREILEETGLIVDIGRLTGVYYDPDYDMHHFVFTANYDHNKQQPKPSSAEILECRFFSLDNLPKPMSDFTYNRIKNSLNKSDELFYVIGPRQWIE